MQSPLPWKAPDAITSLQNKSSAIGGAFAYFKLFVIHCFLRLETFFNVEHTLVFASAPFEV